MNKTVQSSKTDVDERSSQDEQEDNSRFYDSHIDLSDAHKSESAIQRTGTTWSGMPTRTQPPTQVTFEQAYIPATMQYPTGDTRSTGFPRPARYVESRVKLRKFKPGNNVRAWFEIADNEFLARGTFELDKFSALISSLDNEVYDGMSNAIAGLPSANRYEALKSLLIEHYSLTRGQELRKLLSGLLIKGKKPSRLLAEMRSRDGPRRFNNEDLKTLFLEYLPNNVRMTLQVVPGDVYALAAVADKIMEHRSTDSGQELMTIQKPGDSLLNIVTPLDIKLRRKPVFEKPRRLPADKLKVAKAEFQFMMDQEF
ncbi:unnamed protein product [Lasius platythorax]|uniref:DUF7041 domain-containing protein n=1 Tax=Lasius platythorax TaxID=488582 RepID=A0AAV2NMX6_9HYME